MTELRRSGGGGNLAVHLCLAGWLLLPNVVYIATSRVSALQGAGILILSLLIYGAPALIVSTTRGLFMLNAPWALLAGFAAAYMILHGSPVTPALLQSVFVTDLREVRERLSGYTLAAALASCGFVAYVWAALRMGTRRIPGRNLLAAAGLWGIAGLIYLPYLSFEAYDRFNILLDVAFARAAYPASIVDSALLVAQQRRLADGPAPVLPALAPLPDAPRRIFVLVIGESTRAQTFREVEAETQSITRLPGIVQFADALAQANFSDASMPMMLTGARTIEESRRTTHLIHWQNAAGCLTAVVSNNTGYEWASAARIRDVAGVAGIIQPTRYDHDMLDTVAGLLSATAPKHLCLTLHMAGSHFDYAARYRPEFERYPVRGDSEQRLRASYKNSVVMVLDLLRRLVLLLDRGGAETLLVFASDHGENLMEIDRLREHVAAHPTEFELRVPLVVWGSAPYRESHALQWSALQANAARPVSNSSVAPTLLDAMGVPDAYFPAERSLLRAQLSEERIFVRPDYTAWPEAAMRLAPR